MQSDSPSVKSQANSKRTPEGFPVHSLRPLLERLGALALNDVSLAQDDRDEFPLVARPTASQAQVSALLGVDPCKIVPGNMAS